MNGIPPSLGSAPTPEATTTPAKHSTLPLLAVCCFVTVSVILDRATAHSALTLHDPRSPLFAILATALASIAWRHRQELPPLGRAGTLMCIAGLTSNLMCMLTDPDGVSDYLHIQAHGILLVFNLADLALLAGTGTIICSILDRRLSQAPPVGSGHSSGEPSPAPRIPAETPRATNPPV